CLSFLSVYLIHLHVLLLIRQLKPRTTASISPFLRGNLLTLHSTGGTTCAKNTRQQPTKTRTRPVGEPAATNLLQGLFNLHRETQTVGGGDDAEKVSSLGKDWHKFCLKCGRCNKTLNAGGHAEHDGKPFCHKPCYAALFGPKGVNIGGAGSYVYEAPLNNSPTPTDVDAPPKPAEEKVALAPRAPVKASSITTFSGEANLCPRCNKKVYFAEKVTSLGKDWHRPCLRCERCSKTLAAGSHAEVGESKGVFKQGGTSYSKTITGLKGVGLNKALTAQNH
uniref:Cysteine-rich protein 2 n=1 Tax=Hucho hucho TaxID=62062 RepID=A0A4W5K2P2_9TELE